MASRQHLDAGSVGGARARAPHPGSTITINGGAREQPMPFAATSSQAWVARADAKHRGLHRDQTVSIGLRGRRSVRQIVVEDDLALVG